MPPSSHRLTRFICLGLLATAAALPVAAQPVRADVTGTRVKQAIRKGVDALRRLQGAAGTWPDRQQPGGMTCLATLALLQAGERPDSPAIAAALPFIRDLENQHVYVTALKIMVLAQADPQKSHREISAAAQWLIKAQGQSGLWRYGVGAADFDHSNSQFALLGLYAAAEAGVSIPAHVWIKAQAAVARTQNADGGWSYQEKANSYGSMTAAGVADLMILGARLQASRDSAARRGTDPACGTTRTSKPLADGLNWLARHFRADRNPAGSDSYTFYWLYAVERCGVLSGQRFFGQHDWYRAGARYLARAQRADGTWGDQLEQTCFAILFLAKGHKALLVQKLQWSDDAAWNLDPRGLEYLLAFIDDKFGEPVAWQSVRFDAPLEEWLAAPLLYIHGRELPEWNAAQRAKVRAFIEQGGTLLAGACCGRKEFRDGFTQFITQTFPEVPLRELGPEHSVFHVLYDCEPSDLMGVEVGCRTSIFFCPKDPSYLWQEGDGQARSARALELGTNIAGYALGRRPLMDRLDAVVLPATPESQPAAPARDALRLAQVVYEGDWRPFPRALVHLAEFLRRELNLDAITQYRAIRLTDPELFTCPVLYLAGHYGMHLSPEEQAALATHVRRGGFVLADNCCGPEPFDTAFRSLVRDTFPDATLERLPPDHPIFRGQPGFDVRSVHFGPDVRRTNPDLQAPELWGLELNGRLALVYSPYALGCGLDGQEFEGCWGLAAGDARRLAANIILYALTH